MSTTKIHSRNVGRRNRGMKSPRLRLHFIPRLADDDEVLARVLLVVVNTHLISIQEDHIPFQGNLVIEVGLETDILQCSNIALTTFEFNIGLIGSKNINGI